MCQRHHPDASSDNASTDTVDCTADPIADGPSRRGFLSAATLGAAGLGVAGLGLGLAAPATAAPSRSPRPSGRWRPDTESRRFTLAVMPDTQYLFDGEAIHPAPLAASLHYLLETQGEHNTVFLAHLGDLTQNGAAAEMAAVSETFTVLDQARAAYSVGAGNHDVSGDDQRGSTPYLTEFGPQRFRRSPSYRGASADGYNSYHVFRAGGTDWLVLALDWRTSDSGLAWARSVLAQHPTLPVILTAHDIVGSFPDGTADFDDYGQHLWDELIKDHDQIFLTLNGHYWGPGRAVKKNTAGHDVHLHITNYQNRYYGGAAMIRLYHVDLDRGVIDVETLSPFLLSGALGRSNELANQELVLTGDVDRFTLEIDFDARFAGFRPVPARRSRTASAVLVPRTAAYWRFDGHTDGEAVAGSTVVRDLSGGGNHLVVANRPGHVNGALTWSSAHHPDQPAFGSLAFTGGRPGGDYLHTVDGAPINSDTFESGYTIEAFFFLRTDWDGDANGFCALLSRFDSSSAAGKATVPDDGDPQEPVATLSLSGDRELQWCIYPSSQDGSLTNWGHELPLGAWWHVAVVNDTRHTTLYVDGCPVVRNPSTRNRGIATAGHAWLLGGYEYGGKLDQVFVGSIGDVRIVRRALRPGEFMNAG